MPRKPSPQKIVPENSGPQSARWAPVAPAEWMHISAIKLWDRNPRVNTAAVPRVKASILEWGFTEPVIVWPAEQLLVAGHTRIKALEEILREQPGYTLPGSPGPGHLPARGMPFRSRAHAEAYALADNRLGEYATWDDDALATVLRDMEQAGDAPGFDVMGFGDDEVARILAESAPGIEGDMEGPSEPTTVHGPPAAAGRIGDVVAAPDQESSLSTSFKVLVNCTDEAMQKLVLALCIERGWSCRALI